MAGPRVTTNYMSSSSSLTSQSINIETYLDWLSQSSSPHFLLGGSSFGEAPTLLSSTLVTTRYINRIAMFHVIYHNIIVLEEAIQLFNLIWNQSQVYVAMENERLGLFCERGVGFK